MRHLVLVCVGLVTLLASGCAAPDPIDLGTVAPRDPAVRLLFPDPITTTTIPVDADGELSFLVVVDLLEVEFVPPTNGLEANDTEGHWHVFLDEAYKAPQALFYDVTGAEFGGGFNPGDTVTLKVDVRRNDHSPFSECDPCEQAIEFEVVAAASADSATEQFEDWLDEQDDETAQRALAAVGAVP